MWKAGRLAIYGLVALFAGGGIFIASAFSAENDGREIEDLVRSLVSRNKRPPPARPEMRYVFPPGFDQQENHRVIAARDALLAKGVAAFPYLIAALDDSRYSYTKSRPNWATHFDVQSVCLGIIRVQLEICPFMRPVSTLYVPTCLPPAEFGGPSARESMQKWWSKRKHMSLRDLQLEFVEWAISSERQRGFMDKEEEAAVLGWYKPLQTRLKSSEKAIRVGFDGQFLDEEKLKPGDSDLQRWYDRWSKAWGLYPSGDPPIRYNR
jgi:hypothetical protein